VVILIFKTSFQSYFLLMRILSRCSLPIIFCATFILTPFTPLWAQVTNGSYLADNKLDPIALLMPPPLPDSPEQKFDLGEVEAVHHSRPGNDVVAALAEDKGVTPFSFTNVVGDFFLPEKFPRTATLLRRVQSVTEHEVNLVKNYWKRPRPYVVDPDLIEGKAEKSFSYPSGHSTQSMTLALVLTDLFPDKRAALLARAREIGWHRVELARHYPTDIFAGRVLAQAIVREMKNNPDFQKDFAASKSEIAAAVSSGKN
jgi:acid phosphatase (class A)